MAEGWLSPVMGLTVQGAKPDVWVMSEPGLIDSSKIKEEKLWEKEATGGLGPEQDVLEIETSFWEGGREYRVHSKARSAQVQPPALEGTGVGCPQLVSSSRVAVKAKVVRQQDAVGAASPSAKPEGGGPWLLSLGSCSGQF